MNSFLRASAGLCAVAMLSACANAVAASAPPVPAPPTASVASASRGEQLFNQTCAACHGVRGTGTQIGPPLVNKIYEPGHHSDAAFLLAVRNGSIQHHWNFGNMPA